MLLLLPVTSAVLPQTHLSQKESEYLLPWALGMWLGVWEWRCGLPYLEHGTGTEHSPFCYCALLSQGPVSALKSE